MNPTGSDAEKENSGWELRSGGVLVQRKENEESHDNHHHDDGNTAGAMIKIKVSHGTSLYEVSVPPRSTFGDLKKVLAPESGLEPQEQRLFFRGREKDDAEACEAVAEIRGEVDKLSEKVSTIQASVNAGKKVDENEFIVSTELLMRQLLKLDGIEADGEARIQRKTEVRRVQHYVDALDALKARNSNPFADCSNTVSVTTQWETFDSGVESLTAPPMPSTKITQDWEQFD
ncbi:hypothetical protein Ancab_032251 [Ancistrocladus abbreviatus]